MANEKFSEFTVGNPEILVGLEAGDNVQNTPGANKILITDTSGKLSTRLNYKVYTALLTQSGTDAPVATVLENTIGTITWGYTAVGKYGATSAGLFTLNKTTVFFGGTTAQVPNPIVFIFFENLNVNGFSVITLDGASADDSLISNTPIEIRVYY